jgi:hypothetical protein
MKTMGLRAHENNGSESISVRRLCSFYDDEASVQLQGILEFCEQVGACLPVPVGRM